jgi:hypothetical protein
MSFAVATGAQRTGTFPQRTAGKLYPHRRSRADQYMGLGDKAAALALAERAIAANPIEKDAMEGPVSSRIELQFAEMKDPVKDKLKRFGLLDQIGTDAFHPTIGAAVDAYLAEHAVDWKP